MTEVKHTPTPWKVGQVCNVDGIEHINVSAPDGYHVCKVSSRDFEESGNENLINAAHIVKCVNMHDELVDALKDIMVACEVDCGTTSEDDDDNESVGSSMDESNVITDMALKFGHMRRAREALKKAGAL